MKPYTFFKHDGGKSPPTFDLGEFANDSEARNHAHQLLLDRPQYTAIEVWDGIGEPFTVERSHGPSQLNYEAGSLRN